MLYYQFTLPMPVSINAAHTVRRGEVPKKYQKYQPPSPVDFARSKEYTDWLIDAGIQWRKAFPFGVQKLGGRIRVDYCFVWVDGARGTALSDIGNREKALSDFIQGKVFENDRNIDEQGQYRRLVPAFDVSTNKKNENHVIIRVTEIPDRRHDDPALIFKALDNEMPLPSFADKRTPWQKLQDEAAALK